MESTISTTSKTLTLTHCHISKPTSLSHRLRTAHHLLSLRSQCISHAFDLRKPHPFSSTSSIRNFCASPPPTRSPADSVSGSVASFASVGGGAGVGGGGFGGGGDGGGGGGSDSGSVKTKSVARGEGEEVAGISNDVIILDVRGMTCGGCAASVKRILESQPQVSSATVNLTTETAIIWPVSEAKVASNWQQQLGEVLAKHLSNCGFKSNLQGQGAFEGDVSS